MAAADTALADILSNFTTATEAAVNGLPDSSALTPPENGISLLDAKSEIFLAYLQALALRNLNVIRSIKAGGDTESAQALSVEITKQLVEQRVYLERGVKPLEQRIKYQVDKVVTAADDAERAATMKAKAAVIANSRSAAKDDNESAGSDDDSSDDDAEEGADADGMAFRPSAASVFQPQASDEKEDRRSKSRGDGVYRPPRIAATSMPTTERKEKKDRSRPIRSAAVDEYIANEMDAAPLAEPSIGSTITGGGRGTKDRRQMAKEEERRVYEETNLVRLPKESKKDMKKFQGREQGAGFGGEEWKGLGDSLDRIGDLTRRKGRDSALDKSRKRRATEDGPLNSGIGDAFDVKAKRMQKKARR